MDNMLAFKQCLDAPDDTLNLGRAALLIALEEYPDLDIDSYIERLDRLADRARARLTSRTSAQEAVEALNCTLFDEEGFAGNTSDYYDPRNSLLNEVLDRKLGIPITLSVVYLEVGRRLGLPLSGISFPGHFLVKLPQAVGDLVLDPFHGGKLLQETELTRRLGELFHAHSGAMELQQLLQNAGKREILARLLRNLKAIYFQKGDLPRSLSFNNWILLATPDSAADIRDRGLLLEQLDCAQAAASDYRRYLTLAPAAADRSVIRQRLGFLEPLRPSLN
ncbi:MAG: tetratricopeptide repeat protein [Candidatus Competibacteraceae bacterium]|jgi:regulator of sirC expression with transglutaminase-like and TPR domain|nr:tetratricopeptide repeat protein [Candidatus Competibacteraceae bacterium]